MALPTIARYFQRGPSAADRAIALARLAAILDADRHRQLDELVARADRLLLRMQRATEAIELELTKWQARH